MNTHQEKLCAYDKEKSIDTNKKSIDTKEMYDNYAWHKPEVLFVISTSKQKSPHMFEYNCSNNM